MQHGVVSRVRSGTYGCSGSSGTGTAARARTSEDRRSRAGARSRTARSALDRSRSATARGDRRSPRSPPRRRRRPCGTRDGRDAVTTRRSHREVVLATCQAQVGEVVREVFVLARVQLVAAETGRTARRTPRRPPARRERSATTTCGRHGLVVRCDHAVDQAEDIRVDDRDRVPLLGHLVQDRLDLGALVVCPVDVHRGERVLAPAADVHGAGEDGRRVHPLDT